MQRYSTLLQGRFEVFFHTMYILIHLSDVFGLCYAICFVQLTLHLVLYAASGLGMIFP